MASPTTPQVFRVEAEISLPNHCRCLYQDDLLQNLVIFQGPGGGAFVPRIWRFLPGHLRPQRLPGGVVSAPMRTDVWVLQALDVQPILVPAVDSISKRDFSFHTGCISGLIFAWRQLSDRCLCGLLPTPFA